LSGGDVPTRSESKDRKRVALAGVGTVGGGVYERLAARPQSFEVVGIVCRDPSRHAGKSAPAELLTTDAASFGDYDILVETIGGVTTARDIVLAALERGAHVVTANKALLANFFAEIDAAAKRGGGRVIYSAAVGGGVPMLETVDDIAARTEIRRLEAVVNGTTNLILDRLGAGASLEAAIREAQDAGFAEADPSADIDGADAAQKLSLLARRAFGVDIDPNTIPTDKLASLAPEKVVAAVKAGSPYKQVALAERTPAGVTAEVRLRQVPADSPLAKPRLEENCLVITCADGTETVLHGKGAGRDPTADSVFSDIETLVRSDASEPVAAI